MLVSAGKARRRLMVSLEVQLAFSPKICDLSSLPNLDVSPSIDSRPYTQYILPTPDAQHSATDFFACFGKLIADNCKEEILPISIRDTFLQSYDPFATPLILFIFPDWPNAFLKDVVIRDRRECRGPLEMRVYCPESLHCGKMCKGYGGLLII